MRTLLSWGTALVLGLLPCLVLADPQPKEYYAVRPSTQTIKRRQSTQTLAQSTDASQAGPGLLEAAKDKDPVTRTLAVQGLGSLKYKEGEPKLAQLLASDPDAQVREASAVSLRQMEDPQVVSALMRALKDSAMNVRVTALMGLGRYRDESSRPAVEAATKDKAVEVRRTALYVLSRIGNPASALVVQGLLKDPDIAVRSGAAQTLGELHAKDSKAVLESLLKDPSKAIQASAARSLLMLGDSAGFETAKSLTGDPDLSVRLLSIDALGWSRDPTAETELSALLTTVPADSRTAVQESLTRTKQLRKQ